MRKNMKPTFVQTMSLLSALAVAAGCGTEPDTVIGAGAEASEPGTEPVGVISEALTLGIVTFDPPTCTGTPTVCNGMHCCPFGKAMTGAHYASNTFRCQRVVGATEVGCFLTDQNNTRTAEGVTMKGCPVGTYMKGHHVGNNQLTCCPYPLNNTPSYWTLDGHPHLGPSEPPTTITHSALKRWGDICLPGTMHACPFIHNSNFVMEGVHLTSNYYLCAGTPIPGV
jgi:hypothetical protein